MSNLFVFTVLISTLYVTAIDYACMVNLDTAAPCPGKEDHFIDSFLELSHMKTYTDDDDITVLDGFATVILDFEPKAVVSIKIDASKYNGGRLASTAFTVFRPDVCQQFFGKDEIWYDLFKEFNSSMTKCPPDRGTKYVFKKKPIRFVISTSIPAKEGTYRITVTLQSSEVEICFLLDVDARKKS